MDSASVTAVNAVFSNIGYIFTALASVISTIGFLWIKNRKKGS